MHLDAPYITAVADGGIKFAQVHQADVSAQPSAASKV